MSKIIDKYIGQQFGCYKIIGISNEKTNDGHKKYIGKCVQCGYIRKSRIINFQKENANHSAHNFCKQFWKSENLRNIFCEMRQRCYNPNIEAYKFYGAKGIKVCDEWLNNPKTFNDWAINNGYQDGLTIDRIDETKNYCPENCHWITQSENSKWKSTTNRIEVNGIVDSGKGWSKRLGLGVNFINTYLRNNGMENTIEFIKNSI